MKTLLLFTVLLFSSLCFGQTFPTLKVGDGAPIDASAALEVKSTTKAVLFPRMTTTQKNAVTAANGDMVFDTTLGLFSVYQGGAWQSLAAVSGVVSSVGLSMPAIFTVSGSPVTSSGTLTATLASQSANLVWASPNGSSGAPTFRSLVGVDLPFPSSSTLGGVESYALVSHQWISSISTLGVPTSSQPAFSDISGSVPLASQVSGILPPANGGTGSDLSATGGTSQVLKQTTVGGNVAVARLACSDLSNSSASCSTDTTNAANISSGTLPAGRLPNPTASTLGGVESYAAVTHQFVNSISTSGVPSSAQPAFSDLSGSASLTTQVSGLLPLANGGTNADLSATGGTSQVLKQTSVGGAVSVARLACSDLSNSSTSCSTDATNASNISSGTLPAGRLPNPTASTLGGVESYAAVTHQFVTSISTSGVPASAQPAFSDVSGTADLTSQVTGVLPRANGGTGQSAVWTADGTVYASSTSVLASTTTGSTGQVLTSNGVASPPTYQTAATSKVTTSATNVIINWAQITNNGTCGIGAQGGSWMTSATHTGGANSGACILVYTGFSAAPNCHIFVTQNNRTAWASTAPNSTTWTPSTGILTGSGTEDDNYMITCIGTP